MLHECHPETGNRYDNALTMRTEKLRRWRELERQVKHLWWVQYESLAREPELLIRDFARMAGRDPGKTFQPVNEYKGRPEFGDFQSTRYQDLSPQDLDFIVDQLDWQLEGSVGYFPPV